MKSGLSYTLFLLISISGLWGQTTEVPCDTTFFRIEFDHWENCETGQGPCDTLHFVRPAGSGSSRTLLIMPCGGTFTDVSLSGNDPSNAQVQMKVSVSAPDCPPIFDLTEIPDGTYLAYMLACGLGGPVWFTLKTRK